MPELDDWFAVVSYGTYPTPTPSAAKRAYLAASYGLRHELSAAAEVPPDRGTGLQSGEAIRILHAAKAIGII